MAKGAPIPSHPTPPRWMEPLVAQGLLGPWTPRWAGTRPRPGLRTCLGAALGPAGRSAALHQSPRPSDSLKINLLQRFPAPVGLCSLSIPNGPGPRHSSAGGAAWGHRRSPVWQSQGPEHSRLLLLAPAPPAARTGREGPGRVRGAALGHSKPFPGRREPSAGPAQGGGSRGWTRG